MDRLRISENQDSENANMQLELVVDYCYYEMLSKMCASQRNNNNHHVNVTIVDLNLLNIAIRLVKFRSPASID